MKKITMSIVALSTFALSANALNLNEAINLALNKNLDIKSTQYDYLTSIQNEKASKSAYLPKASLGYAYNTTSEPNFNSYESEKTVLSATVSYNLFNGFRDEANLNSSKYLSKSSEYSLEASKQDVVLNVITYYINYLTAKNNIKTYESAYKLYEEQYRDSKNRFNQGLIPKNELLQVEVNMQSAKQNIVQAKGDLKVAKSTLSNVLGGVDLTNENIEDLDEKLLTLKSYDSSQLENRSEIKALKMTINSTIELEKANKSSYYPSLDATAGYSKYYDTFDFKKYDVLPTDDQATATLSASWNLYNGGYDEAQIQKAKITSLKTKNQLQNTRLSIKLQYENAKSNLDVALQNLQTAKTSLSQAKENYQIVKNRFDGGIDTSTDVTDANYLLTQARQSYTNAYFNKYLAIATLDRVLELKNYSTFR